MRHEAGQPRSQTIGCLTSRIVNTLTDAATTTRGSSAKLRDSVTVASQNRTNTATPIGMPRGEIASELQRISLPAILDQTDLRGPLHRNPAQFLPPSVRSALVETWVDGNSGAGWDGFVQGYALIRPLSEGEYKSAIAFADETLEPAGEDFILTELARLRALTVSREIGLDLPLVLSAYADELAHYPADAVRDVLRGWRGKFWPSWSEIVDPLERIVIPRKALRDALMRGCSAPELEPKRPLVTEQDKREIDEALKKLGIKLDERGHKLAPEPMTKADREQMARELAEHRAKWAAVTSAGE